MKRKIIRLSTLVGLLVVVFIFYKIGPLQIWSAGALR